MYYDAMICKLTTYGKDRNDAIEKSIDALDNYAIRGVTHNIPLLRDILTEPTFLSGTFTTNYLPEVYPEGFQGHQLTKVIQIDIWGSFVEDLDLWEYIQVILVVPILPICWNVMPWLLSDLKIVLITMKVKQKLSWLGSFICHEKSVPI